MTNARAQHQSESLSFKSVPFKRVALIGLGLIGSSWVKALKAQHAVEHVTGVDTDENALKQARRVELIDEATHDVSVAVKDADLVIIAVPILAVRPVLEAMRDTLPEHAIVTDVCSVKGHVASDVAAVLGAQFERFVLGHPIAGSERSGVDAADEHLFEHHTVILTPQPHTCSDALARVQHAWQQVGAHIELMDVAYHDEVLAATSHLPHLLAYSLVDTLSDNDDSNDIFQYAAGGFRDFTRIAASSPDMWRDIFLTNREQLLQTLGDFQEGVQRLRHAIEDRDATYMMDVMSRAKSARDYFSSLLTQRAYMTTMNQTSATSVTYTAHPKRAFHGTFRVPGDKSISHRSIMLGSLANGVTQVSGFLEGEDSLATLQAFRDMGVVIEGPKQGKVTIHGVGLHGLKAPKHALYVGNSGTSMRLLAGLLAGQAFAVEMTGDSSLSKRPMKRVADPLALMGASVSTGENGRPPLHLNGCDGSDKTPLQGIHYTLPMASAQVKSCVLLAGLYAKGETSVTEPAPTRDHTERMLKGFGYDVQVNGSTVSLRSGGKLTATSIDVPADISSAAFFMVAASIADEADITLEHVGMNPTRIGVINILRAMNARIEVLNEREVGGEPVADIRVQSSPLKGIHIPEDQVPLAIDEFPALFIAAACADGETVLTGAEELRVKESDRIQAMVDGLTVLGVEAQGTPDGAIIRGVGHGQCFGGGEVQSHDDHRIAMSFTIASLRASSPIVVHECANVATSFPSFVELVQSAGLSVDVSEEAASKGEHSS